MQHRNFYCRGLLITIALATLLAPACVHRGELTLSGVGCPDPSCNEVNPETRMRLRCIGAACSEPLPSSETEQQAATEKSSPQTAEQTGSDSPAASAGEAATEEPSKRKIKVYYEGHERR